MSVAVVVDSWDRYRNVWPGFCHGFNKYWADCPWPLYFVTNELDAPCGISLKVGEIEGWGAMTKRAVERVDAPIILMMLDDYWLIEDVDTKALSEFASLVGSDVGCIQICPSPKQTTIRRTSERDDRLAILAEWSGYRATLQASFWDRQFLLDIIKEKENPWDFEMRGTKRTLEYSKEILTAREHKYLKYAHRNMDGYVEGPVYRGRWTYGALKYAKDEGIDINFERQPCDG